MNAPGSSGPSEANSESAAPDPSVESPALTDIREQLHQGCSVDINDTIAKIADAGQRGTSDSGQAVVELEQLREQDRPIVSDDLNETQALSSKVSDTDASKSQLEGFLTFSELSSAVLELNSGRSPGLDGLSAEFYKGFWNVLGQDLYRVFLESFNQGVLPLSCHRAELTLIPKKGDLGYLKNWRPVSILY